MDLRSKKTVVPDLPSETLHPSDPLREELDIHYVVEISSPVLSDGTVIGNALSVVVIFEEAQLEAVLGYEMIDGQRRLIGIDNLRSAGRGHIHAADMTKLRFGVIEQEVDRILAWEEAQKNPRFQQAFGSFHTSGLTDEGTNLTKAEADLLQISLLYSGLDMSPDPYPAMAQKLDITAGSCRNKVAKARKAGFLEPTIRGRRNHRLTQKAKDMLLNLYDNNGDT